MRTLSTLALALSLFSSASSSCTLPGGLVLRNKRISPSCAHGDATFSASRSPPGKDAIAAIPVLMGGEDEKELHIFKQRFPTWLQQFLPRTDDAVPQVPLLLLEHGTGLTADRVASELGLRQEDKSDCSELLSSLPVDPQMGGGGFAIYVPTAASLGNVGGSAAALLARLPPVLIAEFQHRLPGWVEHTGVNTSLATAKTKEGLQALHAELSHLRTPRCFGFRYPYVINTQWYAERMFQMPVLDYFDFWLKVDTDIGFTEPTVSPSTLLRDSGKVTFFSTNLDYTPWSQCTEHLHAMEGEAMLAAAKGCTQDGQSFLRGPIARPAAEGEGWYDTRAKSVWWSNFIGGWLGLTTSKEYMAAAHTMANSRYAWEERWTDQEMWQSVMGLFSHEKHLLDLTSWRVNLDHTRTAADREYKKRRG